MLITNAFSINMLVESSNLAFQEVSVSEAKNLAAAGLESAIGHADTANVVGSILGCELAANRVTIELGDEPILVAQYTGPRLAEGATELPQGARIQFWLVYRITTIQKMVDYASRLPSGLGDPKSAEKLLAERDELIEALEAYNAARYEVAAKYAPKLGVTKEKLMGFAGISNRLYPRSSFKSDEKHRLYIEFIKELDTIK